MTWTVRREGAIYIANDGDRDRAHIQRAKHSRWRVWRLTQKLDGTTQLGGCDTFKTFAEAKKFCVATPRVWGR